MKNRKKHVLILGGSSDIGTEVVENFLRLGWNVTAHFFKNKKKLYTLKKNSKNLNIVKFNFANYNNTNIEKLMVKKFNEKYDSIVNLIGYVDNKGFENTNLNSILKSITINALIPILIEKMLVKRMLLQKWGRILNCSSIGVKFGGGANSYNYSLSKHCLEFIPNSYKNIEFYPEALVEVYNRSGDRVYRRREYKNTLKDAFNGKVDGKRLPSATYYYIIDLENGDPPFTGTVTIVR